MGTRLVASLLIGLMAGVLAVVIARIWKTGSAERIESVRLALARVFRVVLMLAFIASYALLRRDRRAIAWIAGFLPARGALRSYGAGFLAGAVPVVALIALLTALGARVIDVRATAGSVVWLVLKYVLAGVVLVILEEGLFRGLIQHDLTRAFGARIAVVAGSLFFAVTHFLGVTKAWRLVPDPAPSGFDVAGAVFAGLERMARDWPQLVGLFLAGLILATLRLRTGTLWLAMGVHAGWYWVLQVDQGFVTHVDLDPVRRFWLGSEKYLDGVVGWVALLATLVLALKLRLPGGARSQEMTS
jgi:membrane protease YdiL (CAAX protease family)